jgi:hypothetical protein
VTQSVKVPGMPTVVAEQRGEQNRVEEPLRGRRLAKS